MEYGHNITNPDEELKALALMYVQAHNLIGKEPGDLLDLYNSTLNKLHAHYEYMRKNR